MDAVSLRYERLSLWAKTKFHVDQLKVEIARLKMLILQECHRINKMEEEFKYIQTLKVAQKKESTIFQASREQQQAIWYRVCVCTETLDKPIIINNFDNEKAFEWAMQNSDIMHFSLTIPRPFSTLGMATNQLGSPLVDLNHTNIGKTSGGENAIAIIRGTSSGGNAIAVEFNIRNEGVGESKGSIDSAIKNEGADAPKRDAKVGLEIQLKVDTKVCFEVQPITMVMAPISHWYATAISTLAFSVAVSICHQPTSVCSARSLLFRTQLLSHATYTESVALSVKMFEEIQNMLLYKGLFTADDLDD